MLGCVDAVGGLPAPTPEEPRNTSATERDRDSLAESDFPSDNDYSNGGSSVVFHQICGSAGLNRQFI